MLHCCEEWDSNRSFICLRVIDNVFVYFCLALTTIVFMKSPTHAAQSRPCQSNDAFYFNVQPKGISVREGGRAFLECNVSNHCNIQFHWTLNEQTIINTTRRYQNGSNLVITRVNRTLDGAEFHCIATLATTTVLSKQSQPAVLSIQCKSIHIISLSTDKHILFVSNKNTRA